MPSSSSASSTFQLEYPICNCGKPSPIRKSKTKENPGRRFLGCGNYEEKGKKNCDYFYWIDPASKEKQMEDKIQALESENRALHLKCEEREKVVQELVKEKKKLTKKLMAVEGLVVGYKWKSLILLCACIMLWFTRKTVFVGNGNYLP
ncbi:hypothetical protein Vadar_029157 [Vaccinium darrowii]|uniref:Uncharacterized protein n=1 Tax=Vaccinium darrowii TaxID=229202 RepID=A0ACB7XLV3_9ERIC|nr:hypothetical protein Vadar_029157 [Vaccinium darrowii]